MTEDGAQQRAATRDRALLRAAATAILSKVLTAVSTVVALAICAHELSKGQLGVVAVLSALAVFLGFGDFGLGARLMTHLPPANARGDTAEMRRLVTITFSTLCGFGLAVTVLGVASAYLTPWPSLLGATSLNSSDVRLCVVCFFLSGALAIPASLASRVLSAMQRSSTVYEWFIASAVFSLGLTIVDAAVHAPMWPYVIALAGIPTLVAVVQTIWVFVHLYPELRPTTLVAPRRDVTVFVRSGLLFAIYNTSALVAYCLDSLVVSSNLGAGTAAVFSLASRMFVLVYGTLLLAGQQMWSALADAIARRDMAWVRTRYNHVLVASASISIVGCGFLVALGRPLTRWWFGANLVPPISLLIVLAIWTVYSAMILQASYVLLAIDKIRMLAVASMIMAPVNLGFSIWLTQRYGITGPILGSIIGLVFIMTVPIIVSTRRELQRFETLDVPVEQTASAVV
jgi:O-antigen/teichoic acid export membrane protein